MQEDGTWKYHQKVYHLKKEGLTVKSLPEKDDLDKGKLEEIGRVQKRYDIYGSLGMQPSDLLFSNKMIWVEGLVDEIYLKF